VQTGDVVDTRKTQPSGGSVSAYLATVTDERRRVDAEEATALMQEVTGADPVLWGTSMIGFGRQPYTTADGKQQEWFAVGLSPRKVALTFYGLTYDDSHEDLLDQLGPHSTGKGCLYVKQLDALDRDVLIELIERSWRVNSDRGGSA
jgi:hypothetical protein